MISVCMATYNGGKYIREQVDSILNQLGCGDELIVSDDGSTDATIAILESYNDPRIKIFHNRERHGVNANFENALNKAKGEYVFLSDQDDVWLPGKVNKCIDVLQSCDCLVHNCKVVTHNLQIIAESFFEYHKSKPGFWQNIYYNSYVGCCMAFKRKILDEALPFPTKLPIYQEGWIASLLAWSGEIKFIPECLILFRRHSENQSSTTDKSRLSLFRKISYRIFLIYLIFKRKYENK